MRTHSFLIRIAAVLGAVVVPGSARADEPVAYAPRGSWTANFADDSCSLERTFVHEQDTLRLRLRQFVPGDTFEITIASETLEPRRRATNIDFAATSAFQKIDYYQTFRLEDGQKGVVFSGSLAGSAPDGPAESRSDFSVYATGSAIDRLTLSDAFESDLTVLTGSLQQPLQIMESCMDDLLAEWGVNAQAHRSLTRKAEPNWSDSWIKVSAPMQRDFRQQKGSDRQEVRLIIDEQGKPVGCRVLQWPDDEPIARRLCSAFLESARIPPALDNESRPIRSYYVMVLSAILRVEYR